MSGGTGGERITRVVLVKPQRFQIEREKEIQEKSEQTEVLPEAKDSETASEGKTKEEKFVLIMERLIHDIERSEKRKEGIAGWMRRSADISSPERW